MKTEKINNQERFSAVLLTEEKLKNAVKQAVAIIDKNLSVFSHKFPSHNSENLYYLPCENNDGWNTGFWTGILWLAYELTGGAKIS